MTELDTLKALLEQRNEPYVENDFGVTWRYTSDPHTATESMDGTLIVTEMTARQAIEATLGRVECRMEYREGWSNDELYPTEAYECSACGFIALDGKPKYCPECGARVMEVTA